MKVPPEITYREVEKTEGIDALVQEKIDKLERMCDHISSCHIAIEKINERTRDRSPYRVRLDVTVPPGHELAAESNPSNENQHLGLDAVIRDAFRKMERQIKDLSDLQRESSQSRNHVDSDETTALVTRIFPEDGYGFIKNLSGEEIYFHRNSVLHNDFDRITVGTGVRFNATEGEKGLQATSVQIVDKPGVRAGKSGDMLIEPPMGWEA
ncbi:MAG TPA: HPF/RaiA family ribosome-associated protein [Trichocoleus sp.]|jgi:ribosomal subunit interface protein